MTFCDFLGYRILYRDLIRKAKETVVKNHFKNYRSVLEYEFALKNKKNPAYSLRAFARDLGLSPSKLSEILSNKQGLSVTRAISVGNKIGYRDEKLAWFCNLVEVEHSRSQIGKKNALKKILKYENGVLTRNISLDQINFPLQWYHLAIRRLTSLSTFKHDTHWVAKKLGLSFEKTQKAINNLIKARLLIQKEDGSIKNLDNISIYSSLMNTKALKRISKSIHLSSFLSLDRCEREYRRQSIHILSIKKADIPQVYEIIKDFEDKLDNLTYKSDKHDEVVSVLISVFPLTQKD